MDSIYARVKRLPRKAAVVARKNMKEQAADAYEFDDEVNVQTQSTWNRVVNKTTVTLIPTPSFRPVTRSSRLALA